MDKQKIKVKLNTTATTEMITAGGFDAVTVALGAEPNIPDIPGLKKNGGLRANVWTPISVYGNEKALGEKVVVVGGSEIGTETGMYLAENGHNVTLLSRQKKLAPEADRVHYYSMFEQAWKRLSDFSFILQATTTSVANGSVKYTDAKGVEHKIEADSVVIAGGMNPRQAEAVQFYGSASVFHIVGDCNEVGNVQNCVRSAFAIASTL
jgi:pyruvate/2-oxoglutarate dehydrogenase complex dihydrolipoamide dehydrogenase (E3) component